MKSKIKELRTYLDGVKSYRQTITQLLDEQQKWRDKYDKEKAKDEVANIDRKIEKIKSDERGMKQIQNAKLWEMGNTLVSMAEEKAKKPIDLSDTRLQSALQHIALGKMDYKRASDIALQFVGNQPALRMLKDTFEEKDIKSNIDKLVYAPSDFSSGMRDYAYNVIWQNGNISDFLRFVGKLAKYEGIEFDEVGNDDLVADMRTGAGLPRVN